MDQLIQLLYDFTPASGERAKSIAYEHGHAIATDNDLYAVCVHNYDKSLECKSVNKWGTETPHIDFKHVQSVIRECNSSDGGRWAINMREANGFYCIAKQGRRPIEQMIVEFGTMHVPYERTMKIFRFMDVFGINDVYTNDKYLYCYNKQVMAFTEYCETENDGIILETTRLIKFPNLEE